MPLRYLANELSDDKVIEAANDVKPIFDIDQAAAADVFVGLITQGSQVGARTMDSPYLWGGGRSIQERVKDALEQANKFIAERFPNKP